MTKKIYKILEENLQASRIIVYPFVCATFPWLLSWCSLIWQIKANERNRDELKSIIKSKPEFLFIIKLNENYYNI